MDLLGWLLEKGVSRVRHSQPDLAPDQKADEVTELERLRQKADLNAVTANTRKTEEEATNLRERTRSEIASRKIRVVVTVLGGIFVLLAVAGAICEGVGWLNVRHPEIIFGGGGFSGLLVTALGLLKNS